MSEISLVFEIADKATMEQTIDTLQERLTHLEMVESVDAFPMGPARLTGVEIVAAIGVTVLIVKGSRELLSELRKLIPEIKALIQESRELKRVWVDVGPDRIPLDDLTEAQLNELALEA